MQQACRRRLTDHIILARRRIARPVPAARSSSSSSSSIPRLHPLRITPVPGPSSIIIRRWLSSSSSENAAISSLEDVIITNSCVKRVKALQQKSGKPDLKLRLAVDGGGCSGFQYTFNLEDGPINEDDRVFERDGAKVVVDEGALELVRGATVDFVDDMMRSAFAVINNPQSEASCGCGSSFAVKNFQNNPAID